MIESCTVLINLSDGSRPVNNSPYSWNTRDSRQRPPGISSFHLAKAASSPRAIEDADENFAVHAVADLSERFLLSQP